MSALVVTDLEKRFRMSTGGGKDKQVVVHAVNGVSLEVAQGEVLTIVGESGCGKSTVAKMLVGLVEPTAGTMQVGDRLLGARRTSEDRRLIQLVSQNPWSALNRRRTLRHALEQPLEVNGVARNRKERRALVEAMTERVGLSASHLGARPADVSGGELARAVLARALLLSPKVLVLDEPTASLDASVKATVINLLRELRAELDLAIVLITHEIGVAQMIADRAAVMYLGRLVEVGPAELVLHRPVHPYTRILLGSVPVADPDHRAPLAGKGEVPSAAAPPRGCSYHPRCDVSSGECTVTSPVLVDHAGVVVACHRVLDLGMPLLMPGALSTETARPAHPHDQPLNLEASCPAPLSSTLPNNS